MVLQIITPTKDFFNETVKSIAVDGDHGRVMLLPKHAPYVFAIGSGIIKITKEDDTEVFLDVMGGYAEVFENKTVLIADTAEWPDEIDTDRAMKAKERAEARLKDNEQDRARALKSLRRAEVRLKLMANNK